MKRGLGTTVPDEPLSMLCSNSPVNGRNHTTSICNTTSHDVEHAFLVSEEFAYAKLFPYFICFLRPLEVLLIGEDQHGHAF